MGLEGIIQSWEAPFWGQAQFSENRSPGSSGSRSRPDNPAPAPAQTPGEALTYIEGLYKAGRIQEVAGWLRRSQAFREAWQAIQQASQQYATAEAAILALRSGGFSTPGPPQPAGSTPKASLPVPTSDRSVPGTDAPSSPVSAAYLLDSPIPAEGIYPAYPLPAAKPSRPLAQGYQVYEKSQRYFSPTPDLINVRV